MLCCTSLRAWSQSCIRAVRCFGSVGKRQNELPPFVLARICKWVHSLRHAHHSHPPEQNARSARVSVYNNILRTHIAQRYTHVYRFRCAAIIRTAAVYKAQIATQAYHPTPSPNPSSTLFASSVTRAHVSVIQFVYNYNTTAAPASRTCIRIQHILYIIKTYYTLLSSVWTIILCTHTVDLNARSWRETTQIPQRVDFSRVSVNRSKLGIILSTSPTLNNMSRLIDRTRQEIAYFVTHL